MISMSFLPLFEIGKSDYGSDEREESQQTESRFRLEVGTEIAVPSTAQLHDTVDFDMPQVAGSSLSSDHRKSKLPAVAKDRKLGIAVTSSVQLGDEMDFDKPPAAGRSVGPSSGNRKSKSIAKTKKEATWWAHRGDQSCSFKLRGRHG